MIKLDSLRAALVQALPELANDPDRLKVFVDKGRVAARLASAPAHPALGFEYRYRLNALLLDFTGDPDGVMIALVAWLTEHQPELLANHATSAEAIQFEVDVIDQETVDLAITLELTEGVRVVPRAGGGHEAVHSPEPPVIPEFDGVPRWTPLREIYRGDDLICSFADRPDPGPGPAPEIPFGG